MIASRLSWLATLVIAAASLPANALDFAVQDVNCTQLDWAVGLSQTEWSVASYVELFFISQQGGQNYSLLYSALNGGAFPTPGTYNEVTNFGNTRLSGAYSIGVGLTDMNGNILTTTSSMNGGTVQVTAVDPSTVTFGDCTGSSAASSAAAVGSSSLTSASVAAVTSSASASQSTATSASMTVTPSSASSSTSTAAPTSTSASSSAVPISSLTPASTSALAPTHSVNKGAIAGAVIGGLILLGIVLALLRWCSSRRRTRKLSRASRRMSPLRPLSLSEKVSRSPKQGELFGSPDGLRPKTARVYASRDTLEVAALGRLSESSRRRSDAYTAHSVGDELSITHMLATSPSAEAEREIQVIQVPFQLTSGPQTAPVHDSYSANLAASSPYLALNRTHSTPEHTKSAEHIPTYPTDATSHARTKSVPLALDLSEIDASERTESAGSALHRSTRASPAASSFKIPRVSVPAYLSGDDIEAAAAVDVGMGGGEPPSRQMSMSSSVRRSSAGGATFISADENPFVDAVEQPDSHAGMLL